MILEYLSWDSNFFNKKIGRIQLVVDEQNNLAELLDKAKKDKYELVYVFLPEELLLSENQLSKLKGKLVDRKIVYRQVYTGCTVNNEEVEEYTSPELTDELVNLAYDSGVYSRYNTDKGFTSVDFQKLYYTWITKSVSNEMADKIFVIKQNGIIEGMVTLKINENSAEIGLLAVSEKARGKKYGSKLIAACKLFLSNKGIYKLDVPTQLQNITACTFYENQGFEKLSITNIYHFWTKQK